jgi:hypothetical protein
MAKPNIPVGSNFLTDPFIGSAIGIDAARALYHAAMMYDGIHIDEHKTYLLFTLAEMGILIGEYFGARAYVDSSLEYIASIQRKADDTALLNKTLAILSSRVLFVNGFVVAKGLYQYKGFLPTRDKIIDVVADTSIVALLLSRQIVSSGMTTELIKCARQPTASGCPAASPMKPYSLKFFVP